MNFLKYKKQIIFGVSIFLFICILGFLILFFVSSKKTSAVSSSNVLDTTINEDIDLENTIDVSDTTEEEIPEIVSDEKASKEELKKEKVTKKDVQKSTATYYIKVNYKANTVTIYTKDSNGNYTVPYKAMVCSCGTYTPTSGTYKTSNKYRWGKLIHNVYGQYSTRIVGSILFHSVPYSSNKNDTLLYNEYDKLGTTASAGCIRLAVRDAKWIYDNCSSGTMVEFYADSNPGPLGKPSAQKISSNEECRNWDPTDPASDNPWHTYKKSEDNSKNKEQENSTNISNTTETPSSNVSNNTTVTENPSNSNNNNNNNNNSNSNNTTVTENNSSISNNTVTNTNVTNNNANNNNNNTNINNNNSNISSNTATNANTTNVNNSNNNSKNNSSSNTMT